MSEDGFRVPLLPKRNRLPPTPRTVREEHEDKENATEREKDVKLSFSPGNAATNIRHQRKIQALNQRHAKAAQDKLAKQVLTPKKVNFELTEESFIEGGATNEERLINISDISCIRSSNVCGPFSDSVLAGPASSTPYRAPASALKKKRATWDPTTASTQSPTPCTPRNRSNWETSPKFRKTPGVDVTIEYESYEEKMERQMRSLSVWCNMLFESDSRFAEVDFGDTKKEADQKLQELLKKPAKLAEVEKEAPKKFSYREFVKDQKWKAIKEKSNKIFHSKNIPEQIKSLVHNKTVSIRDDCAVYNNISLQKTLLKLFFSFNPAWVHLGMEIAFGEEITIKDSDQFPVVMSKFLLTRLFSDPSIMKNKKYAVGTVKMIVTPAGREALHGHFLLYACRFFYFVETAKLAGVLPLNPRLFTRKSVYKCLDDVFSELSRELMSGAGVSLNKALTRIGFKPSYKQSYFDDMEYKVNNFQDLSDGVILGKLFEIVLNCPNIVNKLREPKGDRLRKISNVRTVFQICAENGFNVGELRPEVIVAVKKEAILELLWRIVGVYVLASDVNLRRLSFDLQKQGYGKHVPFAAQADELVFHLCQQMAPCLDVEINSIEELKDGRFLAAAWRQYNPSYPDIIFYDGKNLYDKVVNAAEKELGVPVGLHGAIQLFAHMFLSSLVDTKHLNEAAGKIQRAWRLYRARQLVNDTFGQLTFNKESRPSCQFLDVQQTFIVERDRECAQSLVSLSKTPVSAISHRLEVLNLEPINESSFDSAGTLIDDDPTLFPMTTHEAYCHVRTFAAIRMQAIVRGFLTRRRFSKEREGLRAELLERLRLKEEQRLWEEAEQVRLEQEAERVRQEEEEAERKRQEEERLRLEQEEAERLAELQRQEEQRRLEEEAERQRRLELQRQEEERQEAERLAELQSQEEERLRLERLQREEEEERQRKEAERLRLEQEERERLEELRLRQEEEDRKRQEEEERQRLQQEEEERQRQEAEQLAELQRLEAERLRLEQEERELLAELHRQEAERLRQEEQRRLKEAEAERLRQFELQRQEEERQEAERLAELQRQEEQRRLEQKEAERKREEDELREKKMQKAATTIQSFYRMHLAQKLLADLKQEKLRNLQIQAQQHKAATVIQAHYRGLLGKRTAEELRKRRNQEQLMNKSAVVIQKYVRGYLARKHFVQMKESHKKTSVMRVVRMQACVRGWLVRSRLREAMHGASPQVQHKKISLRKLYEEVAKLRREQNQYAQLLKALQRVKLRKMSNRSISKEHAATTIQSYWRGYKTRKAMRAIWNRPQVIADYGQLLREHNGESVVNNKLLSASKKLEYYQNTLFSERQYDIRVACLGILRLIRLNPQLLVQFVDQLDGIANLLDRIDLCHRDPASTLMLEILCQSLQAIVKSTDAKVQPHVAKFAEEIISYSLHAFHAYWNNELIVNNCVDMIVHMHAADHQRNYFSKLPFYINMVSKKVAKLPSTSFQQRAIARLRRLVA